MTTIAHYSDLHGQMLRLPYADAYVFSGDIYRNYGTILPGGIGLEIVPEQERRKQEQNARKQQYEPLNRDAPVFFVDGNHDFASCRHLFRSFKEVHEIKLGETLRFRDYKIGGFVGVPYLAGEWNHEYQSADLAELVQAKLDPQLDIIISHCPPKGILDDAFGDHIGDQGYRNYLERRLYNDSLPKAILFGHCHEGFGVMNLHGCLVSNAATSYNVLHLPD